jgi:type 1 glutamine amidotransferase
VKRRNLLKALPAAGAFAAAAEAAGKKVLFFTRSAGFEHSVVKRNGGALSHAEEHLVELGRRAGFEVECTKDGRAFNGALDQYDVFAFYTTGDLTGPAQDGSPPMSAEGKERLLAAIRAGKGFVGIHSATDTFHSKGARYENQTEVDPYIAMIGGEFLTHGVQQEASLLATSAFLAKFNGVPAEAISFTDEWYAGKNYAKDLHVLLVQETEFMEGEAYQRPDFPSTWVRKHGQGRVFYTSLGHREDIWTNPFFRGILAAGLAWVAGRYEFDTPPNLDQAAPQANVLKR